MLRVRDVGVTLTVLRVGIFLVQRSTGASVLNQSFGAEGVTSSDSQSHFIRQRLQPEAREERPRAAATAKLEAAGGPAGRQLAWRPSTPGVEERMASGDVTGAVMRVERVRQTMGLPCGVMVSPRAKWTERVVATWGRMFPPVPMGLWSTVSVKTKVEVGQKVEMRETGRE